MEIDGATRRNLELTRTLAGERKGSLIGVVDRTVTGAGARLLLARLSAPLTDPMRIDRRLDMVRVFVDGERLRAAVREALKRCPDPERALARITLGRGGPRDLAAIRDALAILAQMGSYVPANSARIGVVDRLFSRVGAADDLARGRSTFMVEMVETAAILNQAGERALVILDEIGRGTATFDGLSIAWAVVEHLHAVNHCRALFATHYHELTALAAKLPSLACHTMRVKEWRGDVVFLHEVAPGTADRSYGIHVARLAGLPEAAVTRAEQVLETLEKGEQSSAVDASRRRPAAVRRGRAPRPPAPASGGRGAAEQDRPGRAHSARGAPPAL